MIASEKYPKLTISEIASGMSKCRDNARELLTDADILYRNARYPRAYMMLHTACEELAKFFVLDLAGQRLAKDNPPSWKRFWQRLRSHESKVAQLGIQLLALSKTDNTINPDLISAADALFSYDLQPRNASLYVDLGQNGTFRKPSDIDFRVPLPLLWRAATLALRVANQRGETVDELHTHLHKAPTEPDQNVALQVFETVISRLRDAGLSESELTAMIEKHEARNRPGS